jgi:hypothetical protein
MEGIPLPRIAKARDILQSRSLGPRNLTASGREHTSKQWEFGNQPQLLGRFANCEVWRKNFQSTICRRAYSGSACRTYGAETS